MDHVPLQNRIDDNVKGKILSQEFLQLTFCNSLRLALQLPLPPLHGSIAAPVEEGGLGGTAVADPIDSYVAAAKAGSSTTPADSATATKVGPKTVIVEKRPAMADEAVAAKAGPAAVAVSVGAPRYTDVRLTQGPGLSAVQPAQEGVSKGQRLQAPVAAAKAGPVIRTGHTPNWEKAGYKHPSDAPIPMPEIGAKLHRLVPTEQRVNPKLMTASRWTASTRRVWATQS
jgi:hypothetical protein